MRVFFRKDKVLRRVLRRERFIEEPKTWRTFRIFFIFFCSGRGKGESEAPGGGGSIFY